MRTLSATSRKGLLIVFEGTDGTGKSTQLRLLQNYLLEKSLPVVGTFEPTNGKYGKKIRSIFTNRQSISREEELELFIADRREHVETVISPGLIRGNIILCDRYYLSTMAYQGAAGFDPDDILKQNLFAPKPDMALLFHAPLRTGYSRITEGRGEAINDFEKQDYLSKVASHFAKMDFAFIRRINADQTIEEIQREVLAQVRTLPGIE